MAFEKIIKSREARWISEEKYGSRRSFLFWYDLVLFSCGYPIAYIIGNTPFLDTSIDLSYRPFIPREETAYWVSIAIEYIKKNHSEGIPLRILDIFSGSGAIGVALAKEFPTARIFFYEKNPRYVKQIQKNIHLNNVERNTVVLPYYKKELPKKSFDYIFANPPYLSFRKSRDVQKSVLLWEPFSALFAKNNGIFYIQKLIEDLPLLLMPGGGLFLEHDPWQKAFIFEKTRTLGLYPEIFLDQYRKERMTFIKNPNNPQK